MSFEIICRSHQAKCSLDGQFFKMYNLGVKQSLTFNNDNFISPSKTKISLRA